MIEPVSRIQSYSTPKVSPAGTKAGSSGDEKPFSMDQALAEESAREEGVYYERSNPEQAKNEKKEPVKKESDEIFEKPGADAPLGAIDTKNLVKGLGNLLKDLWQKALKIFENIWESKPLTDSGEEKGSDEKTSEGSEKAKGPDDLHREDSLNYYRSKLSENDPDIEQDPSATTDSSLPNDDFDKNIEMLDHIKPFEDKAIKDALMSGDDERFERIITRDGSRHPAISSTLLTQYDSKGQIKQIDPSEENLILRGTSRTNRS